MSDTVNLGDLYDIESAIEENFRTFLLSEGFTKVFTPKNAVEDFQKDRPRLEVRCAVGGQNGHRALCADFEERNDQYAFTLIIQVVTAPEPDADENILHGVYRGRLRKVMSTAAQHSWSDTTNFPYHAIAEALIESGTQPTLKEEDGLEYSSITFTAVVAIRASAFILALTD